MKKKINIVGGGTAGIILAVLLSKHDLFEVHLYEKEKSIGRKFLVAGKGGFNLTNAAAGKKLEKVYFPSGILSRSLRNFDSMKFRRLLKMIGIETYEGSSGRIFPVKTLKPISVLNVLKESIANSQNFIHTQTKLIDIKAGSLIIENNGNQTEVLGDSNIYALGGSSWKVTGSDGLWIEIFRKALISVEPFYPTNCGLEITWPESVEEHIGKPLKNIKVSCENQEYLGECVISKYGLEGNAIYPISRLISKNDTFEKVIYLDFKPQISLEDLVKKLKAQSGKNLSTRLLKIGINRSSLSILKSYISKDKWSNENHVCQSIKNTRIEIEGTRSIDEAISVGGGVSIEELNQNWELKKMKNSYCIGEMVAWDTITGGYLIQGCASMAYTVYSDIVKKFSEEKKVI